MIVEIGEYFRSTYEEFDEKGNTTLQEESIDIFHTEISKVNDLPDKQFIEKWFGIKKEIILGVSAGWSSEEVDEETRKKVEDILKRFPISWPEPE